MRNGPMKFYLQFYSIEHSPDVGNQTKKIHFGHFKTVCYQIHQSDFFFLKKTCLFVCYILFFSSFIFDFMDIGTFF